MDTNTNDQLGFHERNMETLRAWREGEIDAERAAARLANVVLEQSAVFDGDEGIPFLVAIPNSVPGAPPHLHDTGLKGMFWSDSYVLGFGNEVVAEEIARLVSRAIKRDS